jgi:hypothetical protein
MAKRVNKPIFFIGVPRSGTTITFEAFSVHEDLSWFSNHLERHPNFPSITVLSRITFLSGLQGAKKQITKNSKLKRKLPHPAECYNIWQNCCGKRFLYDYLLGQEPTIEEKDKIQSIINKVTCYHGKKRFAVKLTGPSRIHYLNSIFPDAVFIHVIRDGRAVVNSLMNAGFWKERGGYDKPWWENGLTDDDLSMYKRYDQSPLALAAIQWRRIIKIARDEASKIFSNRYYELKYEDFMSEPHSHIRKLFKFSSLKMSKRVHCYITQYSQLKNQNYKYLNSMGKKEIGMLNHITGDLLSQLKYQID